MPTKIKNLTVAITIGGEEIILVSDSINDAVDTVNDKITSLLNQGFAFKMKPGTVVSVNVGELIAWFKDSFASEQIGSLETDVQGFVTEATDASDSTAADGITLDLSDLSFKAKKPIDPNDETSTLPLELSFGFTIKVSLENDFYENLGLENITNVIRLDSVGFSLEYSN